MGPGAWPPCLPPTSPRGDGPPASSARGPAASQASSGGGPSCATSRAPIRRPGFLTCSCKLLNSGVSANSAPWASILVAARTCSVLHFQSFVLIATHTVVPRCTTTAPGPTQRSRCKEWLLAPTSFLQT
eukprot:8436996-Pyramimonas_sp.AAC.1